MKLTTKLWIAIAALALLSPIGLILPELCKAGAAWGEWAVDEMPGLIGHVPAGLARFATVWSAPVPDYAFQDWAGRSMAWQGAAYIISALLGIGIAAAASVALGGWLTRSRK